MSGAIRTALGQIRRYAKSHLDKYKVMLVQNPTPWNADTLTLFAATLEIFKNDLKKFEKNFEKWQEVLDLMEDDADRKDEQELFDVAYKSDENGELIDELETVVATINSHLKRTVSVPVVVQPGAPTPELNVVDTHSHSQTIPTLDIPKFKGDYLKWSSFWQRFDHAVHQKGFPEVEKLISLLGFLDGRALEEVEGFEVCGQNYKTVVQILTDRFGNKQLILKELQTKLRSIQPADGTVESIRTTVNTINNICLQLKNHGVNIDNDSLKLDIIEKLPKAQKDELTWLSVTDPGKTTEDILQRMKQMALKAEICSQSKPQLPLKNNQLLNEQKVLNKTQHSSNDQNQPLKKKYPCYLCEGDHFSSRCVKFPTLEDKLKQLKAQSRCTQCAGQNHNAQNCAAEIKCRACGGPHRAFLCKKKNDGVWSNKPTTSSNFVSVERSQSSLLTKEITVLNPNTNESVSTVVIFDSGSQRSYISDDLIKQLKLSTVNHERLNVQGFGAKASNYIAKLVMLRIKTSETFKDVYANSAKEIASKVPVVTFDVDDLPGFEVVHKKPDIIIGMDYFFEFITSFEQKGKMYIVQSIVGPMVGNFIPTAGTDTVTSLALEPSSNLDEDVQTFWKLENMGIKDIPKITDEDSLALKQFHDSVKFENNRYYVSWPVKPDHKLLPTNAGLAIGRLKSTLKKVTQDPILSSS
uniref:Peptidase aspartic putative domain-containing protein n=1 Tax=Panagrolaimus superbus TaxID=310955 RepID=A0A914XS76_9BILA